MPRWLMALWSRCWVSSPTTASRWGSSCRPLCSLQRCVVR
jgi:hypothetical protein